jgi:4-amino-4-deoxy-L-arabinose transferase-like glycosyltransferase
LAATASLSEDASPRPWLAPLLVVVSAVLAARIATLIGSPLSLQGDEAQYWTWSREIAFGYYSKPPLIAWVIGASTALCGDAAWCVRLPATLFHGVTTVLVAGLASSLFGARVALWTGIAWLTLPAVSFSSLIMSTDALLLTFWAGALWAYHGVLTAPSGGGRTRAALGLAACVALGLNAKYAMVYFLVCALTHLILDRDARAAAFRARAPLSLGIVGGLAGILPNVAWNAVNGWATLGHTADNANWSGPLFHFDQMGEFLGAQAGVFGPIFLIALALAIPRSRAAARALPPAHRMLLAFSVPILLIVTSQALLSRAHANWAATAYPAATILVVALLLSGRALWLKAALALHVTLAAGLYGAVLAPDRVAGLIGRDPFAPMRGWDGIAEQIHERLVDSGAPVLLMDHRMMIANTAYALRDRDITIRAWNHDAKIDHHYEMAWRYDPATDGPRVLLVSPHGTEAIEAAFDKVDIVPDIPRVDRKGRDAPLFARHLEGPK